MEGIQRILARSAQKKEPITSEMLVELVAGTNSLSSLANLRLAAACLLAHAGFLHFDEHMHLHPCDVQIDPTMAKLHIRHSKTDQLWKGDEVLIAQTGTQICSVAMLERHMAKASTDPKSDLFLFRDKES